MTAIVRRSPFFSKPTEVVVANDVLTVRPYQIVVWLSVKLQDGLSRRFPAIVDTGLTLNLAIDEKQLTSWTGLESAKLRICGRTKIKNLQLALYEADLALHFNVPGRRDDLRTKSAYPLKLREGIVVYPRNEGPRLPLLGLRALSQNELVAKVDGKRKSVSIGRPWF
jgi:hypothetical protein